MTTLIPNSLNYIHLFDTDFKNHRIRFQEETDIHVTREILATYHKTKNISSTISNTIIDNLISGTYYEWSVASLTVLDEAIIVATLQEKLLSEFLYYNFDTFPTNTDELRKLFVLLPVSDRCKIVIKKIINVDIFLTIYPAWLIYILLLIYGIFTIPLLMFVYTAIFSLVIFNIIFITTHEYNEHNYIIPRNKYSQVLLNLLVTIFAQATIKQTNTHKGSVHIQHHAYWKELADPTQQSIDTGLFGHIKNSLGSIHDSSNNALQKNIIVLTYIGCLLAIGGISYAILFFVVPAIVLVFGMVVIAESFIHGYTTDKNKEIDFWPVIPFFGNVGLHIAHHKNWTKGAYFGKGLFKFINPSYYMFLLFFRLNSKVYKSIL